MGSGVLPQIVEFHGNLAKYALELDGTTPEGKTILDLGCGQGNLLEYLAKAKFNSIGVDFEWKCIRDVKKRGMAILGNIMEADSFFKPNSFDIVIASHVLEHIQNPSKALEIMKNLSCKWIIISVPNLTRLVNWVLRKPRFVNPGHLHGWDAHHLKTFLEKNCGLKIVRWQQDMVTLTYLRRSFLRKTKPFIFLEEKFLPFLIPQAANSLIVLCQKQ